MRTIKFRVWDKKNKKMRPLKATFLLVYGDASGEVGEIGDSFDDTRNLEEFVLMQFTGLFDKNGKEIYEGDIVQSMVHYNRKKMAPHGNPWVVERVITRSTNGWNLATGKNKIVIGNIYENPELLTHH